MIAFFVADERGSGRLTFGEDDERGSGRYHLLTLVNPQTGDEVSLTLKTPTDRFWQLRAAICELRTKHFKGYQIFESLAVPF